jgi:phosphate-selective porin OprO and OprP
MKPTYPNPLSLKPLVFAVLVTGFLSISPAMAMSEDAKAVLQLLLTKGVITQKDYDDTLNAFSGKSVAGVPPEQVVKEAKNGTVRPSGNGTVSADGQSTFNFTGMAHFDARLVNSNITQVSDKDAASGADNFELRRARIGINGNFTPNISYEVLTNLVGSSPNLIHRAFVNYNYDPAAQVRLGRFKQPFSLEELSTANGISFMERSYGNQLVPSHRLGAMLHGEPKKGITYGASVYQDGFNEISNTQNIGTLTAARGTVNLAELNNINGAILHFGAAVDKGSYKVTPSSSTDSGFTASGSTRATLLSYRTENRGMTNAYRAQIGGDTVSAAYGAAADNAADVKKNLNGFELALAKDAFKFQTEFFNASYDATALNYNSSSTASSAKAALVGTARLNLNTKASYYEFMYNITGESWSDAYRAGVFSTVKPKSNFNGIGKGRGAWQTGIRFSQYEVNLPGSTANSAITDGGSKLSRAENSEIAKTVTYGLNWILNPTTRFMVNYSTTKFDRPVYYLSTINRTTPEYTNKENIFSVRSQFNF